MNKFGVCGTTGPPPKNANNTYMFSANYFIVIAYYVQFLHDHSTKLPVCGSNSPIFMFSPKCVPDDPLGVAGILASGARNCQ